MQKSLASKFLEIFLYIFFITGVAIIVSAPKMLKFYLILFGDSYIRDIRYLTFMLIFVILEGVLGLLITALLISMVRTIYKNPFVMRNVKILIYMGILAVAMALFLLIKCWYYFTIMTLGCALLLILLALFSFTLSDLLRKAVVYKEENDLTI